MHIEPSWADVAAAAPQLATFVADRLRGAPAYLATVRTDGSPRVHPITPILTARGLYVFMEPTSPKAADLRERRAFALHNGVPDSNGTGGEVAVTGTGHPVLDVEGRAAVAAACSYEPADRYVLFELRPGDVRANGYDDATLPSPRRWGAGTPARDTMDPT